MSLRDVVARWRDGRDSKDGDTAPSSGEVKLGPPYSTPPTVPMREPVEFIEPEPTDPP